MRSNRREFQRRSLRLKGHNYAQCGAYFITVCTFSREHILGEIRNSAAVRSDLGRIVHQCWEEIPSHFTNVKTDSLIIMPDHIHGILWLEHCPPEGEACLAPTRPGFTSVGLALGDIVGAFKSASTRQINKLRASPGMPVWQRGYFERVIRNEKELRSIRGYIHTNPLRWELTGKA